MSSTWIAAFLLLLLLVLADSILLLSLMRQIGVLSMRVRPLGAMQDDEEAGPVAGTILPEMALQEVQGQDEHGSPFERELSVLMFVSPTCGLCKSLLRPAAAVAKDYPELDFFLIGEVAVERAAEYARRMSTKLPFFVAPNLFETLGG